MKPIALLVVGLSLVPVARGDGSSGPSRGAILIDGGGQATVVVRNRLIKLLGKPDASVIYLIVPRELQETTPSSLRETEGRAYGLKNIQIIQAADRAEADSEEFVGPLKKAKGVILGGNWPKELLELYKDTRTHHELEEVLDRGGVIVTASEGAGLIGSFFPRGEPPGPDPLATPGRQAGFGFLQNVAIDAHLLKKGRERDLASVVADRTGLLGIGIDESTAIIVEKDRFEVLGASKVAIYDNKQHDRLRYYFLSAGDRFDLKTWAALRSSEVRGGSATRGLPKGAILERMPNQIRVESFGDGSVLRVRDGGTGNVIRDLRGHTKPISAMVLSRNLSWVASAAGDQTIRIFAIRDGLEKVKFKIPSGTITKLEVSDDSRRVIASFASGAVREYEIPLVRGEEP
jgi:cyanophycinase